MRTIAILAGLVLTTAVAAGPVELKHYPLDSLEGVITRTGVKLDPKVSSDGHGSLRISARGPMRVMLFETGDIDVENARLIYKARLKTLRTRGDVYLEMWCHFPGQGEYFSRGLQYAVGGTTDWTSVETMFFLRQGENPDNVKLNLVIKGRGRVWIDDIHLVKAPLE